eukprot:365805-Chlamydomonas_euryale.AAC.2
MGGTEQAAQTVWCQVGDPEPACPHARTLRRYRQPRLYLVRSATLHLPARMRAPCGGRQPHVAAACCMLKARSARPWTPRDTLRAPSPPPLTMLQLWGARHALVAVWCVAQGKAMRPPLAIQRPTVHASPPPFFHATPLGCPAHAHMAAWQAHKARPAADT